ncbi:histidinol-phosphatase [Xanthomonas sp. NCPPB 1067]|uniref:histidinol-phosphatase n=1 Tax=Xanthomonas sp. NCPPB 1067 TaxID=487524 RepID=UPI001E4596EC|nr:histidinol-phosphatase [Xanthomonas sp. NCPPB 1067]MCC4588020.1 histidinol-phosphatase [Xanthomonas sp. NCPPB 1067]
MQTHRIEDPESDFLHRLADLADAQTLPRFRRPIGVDTKYKEGDRFDPVTDADRSAEAAMRSLIRERFPDHAILGEEYGAEGESDYCWVLDPIDGTKPYLCGIPVWGSLIGLTHGGVAVRGMMSQPFTGERFWADADAAWHRRGSAVERLHTRQVALNEAILHTTSPQGYHGALAAGFDRLKDHVRMTRYGGECYAMVMVAAGHIDIALEPSLQAYDIVALIPIIERAGGVVTRVDGGRPEVGGPVLISGSPALHDIALKTLR